MLLRPQFLSIYASRAEWSEPHQHHHGIKFPLDFGIVCDRNCDSEAQAFMRKNGGWGRSIRIGRAHSKCLSSHSEHRPQTKIHHGFESPERSGHLISVDSITHNKDSHRFETEVPGGLAVLEYRLKPGLMLFTHTAVPEKSQGSGVAASLAEAAFEYAREANLKVVPLCPYIAAYLKRHKEHAELVAPARHSSSDQSS